MLTEKFFQFASFDDKRLENPGPDFTVTSPALVASINKHFEANPHDSIRRAAQKLGAAKSTVQVILKKFLNLVYLNDPQNIQELESSIENCARQIDEEMLHHVFPGFIKRDKFCTNSDGKHFENIYH